MSGIRQLYPTTVFDWYEDLINLIQAGGGTGVPGGSDKEVQFNDGGVFAGDPDFTWDKTSNLLTVLGTANITVTDAIDDDVTSVLTVSHETSGTPAAGFGTRLEFETGGITTGVVDAALVDLTAAAEFSKLSLGLVANGTLSELLNFRFISEIPDLVATLPSSGILFVGDYLTVQTAANFADEPLDSNAFRIDAPGNMTTVGTRLGVYSDTGGSWLVNVAGNPGESDFIQYDVQYLNSTSAVFSINMPNPSTTAQLGIKCLGHTSDLLQASYFKNYGTGDTFYRADSDSSDAYLVCHAVSYDWAVGTYRTGALRFCTSNYISDPLISMLTLERNGAGKFKGALNSGVVTLVDGATPAIDASAGNTFLLTAAGDRTIAVPSNATSGQKITIAHTASGADRTLALNTGAGGFRFGTDVTGLTLTTSGKTDYIGCIYNDSASKWDVIAYVKGY